MEVHHHSHTAVPGLHRGKKKWTHYLWEFLMLFLAVFCGFLAENQREHYVEHLRAKEYAKSLFEDLKEDTAEIAGGIRQISFMLSGFDSCISTGLRYRGQPSIPGSFYYYSRLTMTAYTIDWNESTLTQLLQSGNLRYFKNKTLVKKINRYYALHGLIRSVNETDLSHRLQILETRNRLLNPEMLAPFAPVEISDELSRGVPDPRIAPLLTSQLPLQPGTAGIMDAFLNHQLDRKFRNVRLVDERYPDALRSAKEIMELLQHEYHFN